MGRPRVIQLRFGFLVGAILTTMLMLHTPAVQANVFKSLIRKAGGVADDVPVSRADDVAEDLINSKTGQRAVDDALRKTGSPVDDAAARDRAVRMLLQKAVGETDPTILRQLDELDQPGREAAFVLARGSQAIREGIPDIAARSRLLRDGGADTVASIGRYNDLVKDVIRFDAAVKAGRIPSPRGRPAITTQDFGRFFRIEGDRAHHFWTQYVRPHWKKWLAGTALAAVILAPDEYLDAAGELTQEGVRKIGQMAGSVLSGALKGAVEGAGGAAKQTVRETATAAWKTFFADAWALAGLVLLLVVAALLVPWTRRRIIAAIKRYAQPVKSEEYGRDK